MDYSVLSNLFQYIVFMTKIAIPIRPINLEDLSQKLDQALKSQVGVIEIWMDKIYSEPNLYNFLIQEIQRVKSKRQAIQFLLTLKDPSEKGVFQEGLEKRREILENYINIVDFIDMPFRFEQTQVISNPNKLLLSFHDFDKTPSLDELQKIIDKMKVYNPTIYKIACQVNPENAQEAIARIFQLQENNPELQSKMIIIGMGDQAIETRIQAPKFKQPFTFASLDSASKTAAGQLSAIQLQNKWLELGL